MGYPAGSPQRLDAGRKAAEKRRKNNERTVAKANPYNGDGKCEIRNELIDTMYLYGVAGGTIVSLETSQFIFNKAFPARHIHYQNDHYEYEKMQRLKPDNTTVVYGDILDLIDSGVAVDGIWLDYMGTYDTQQENIKAIADSKEMDSCVVVDLTVSTRNPLKSKVRPVQLDRIITSTSEIFKGYTRMPIRVYSDTAAMYNLIFVKTDLIDQLKKDAEKVFKQVMGVSFATYNERNDDNIVNLEDKYSNHLRRYCIPHMWRLFSDTPRNRRMMTDIVREEADKYISDNNIPDMSRKEQYEKHHHGRLAFEVRREMGFTVADFESFVRAYENVLIRCVDGDVCECCTRQNDMSTKRFIRIPDVDILETAGWRFLRNGTYNPSWSSHWEVF